MQFAVRGAAAPDDLVRGLLDRPAKGQEARRRPTGALKTKGYQGSFHRRSTYTIQYMFI